MTAKLYRWFQAHETSEFAATLEERFRGGFFGQQEVELRRETIRCLRNGDLWKVNRKQDGLNVGQGTIFPINGYEGEVVFDGDRTIQVTRASDAESSEYGPTLASPDRHTGKVHFLLSESAFAFSILTQNDHRPLVDVLRESSLTVHSPEEADGSELTGTLVLEGRGAYGHISVWVDPTDGAPRKVVMDKQGSDLTYGGRPANVQVVTKPGMLYPNHVRRRQLTTIDPIRLRESEGRRVFEGFQMVTETEYVTGERAVSTVNVEFSEFHVRDDIPDEAFVVTSPIKDGTLVGNLDAPGVQLEWRGGAIVPVIDHAAAIKQAEVKFKRGYRSPWYLVSIVTLVLAVLALLGYRIYAERSA